MSSAFRVLLVWLEGREEYLDPHADDELSDRQLSALRACTEPRRRGFVLIVRRNWKLEAQARRVRLPAALRELWTLDDGEAVNRLIGYDDGPRWMPGIAGLEPVESRVLRLSAIERLATWEIARDLRLAPSSVRAKRSDARRKLRAFLGRDGDGSIGSPLVKERRAVSLPLSQVAS